MRQMLSSCRRLTSFVRFSLIVIFALTGTANITNMFMLKWAFSDGDNNASVKSLRYIEAGLAERPYIYRYFLIQSIGTGVDLLAPSQQKSLFEKLSRKGHVREKFFSGVKNEDWTVRLALLYFFAYTAVIILTLAFLLACYFAAETISKKYLNNDFNGKETQTADSLTILMGCSLLTPLVFSRWGHFYDFADFALIMLAFLFFIRRLTTMFALTFILASLNKETVFVFPLILIPIANRFQTSKWFLLACALCSFAIRSWLMYRWSSNPGSDSYINLWDNLRFWINPASYFNFGSILAPGIPTPHAGNIIILAPLTYFIHQGLRNLPADLKLFSTVSLLTASALILVVGYKDEFRAASTAFPAILMTLIAATQRPASRTLDGQ